MRKLAIFSFSFSAAVLISVYALSAAAGFICAGLFASAGLLLALFRRKAAARLTLTCLGLAAGLLWTPVWYQLATLPAEQLAGSTESLTATLLDYPEETTYGSGVLALLSDGDTRAKAMLYLDQEALSLEAGSVLSVSGQVLTSEEAGNTAYQSSGAFLIVYADSDYTVLQAEGTGLRTLPARFRHTVQEKIRGIFPEDTVPLMLALLTGDRSSLSDASVSSMKTAGVYHAVAVSGMHVAILAGFFGMLVRRRRRRALLGIPALLLFLTLTGGTAGVCRAVVMQSLVLLADLLQQDYDPPTSLGTAALLMLACNPWSITGTGFQLTFAATAGILLFSDRFCTGIRKGRLFTWLESVLPFTGANGNPLLNVTAASVSVSCGALLLSVPLLAYQNGTVSLISPVSGLLLLWSVTCCFAAGLIAVLLAFLFSPAGRAAAWLCAWPARLFLWGSGLLARLPFAQVSISSVYLLAWLIFVYLLFVLMLVWKGERRLTIPLCAGVLGLSVSLLLSAVSYTSASFSFTALDVGQGQCLAVYTEGVNLLIDCGGDDAGDTAVRFLQANGQTRLDALILTHFDSDHCSGAAAVLQQIPTGVLYIPDVEDDSGNREDLLAAAEACGVPVCTVTRETTLLCGQSRFRIFPPVSLEDDNEACLSILFTCGDFSALVTGDMSQDTEARLLQLYDLPDLDLLVVGHHGSAASTGEALLTALTPELSIISVGADNRYGHPAQEVLDRLESAGVTIYRTDLQGSITVRR